MLAASLNNDAIDSNNYRTGDKWPAGVVLVFKLALTVSYTFVYDGI